MQDTWHLVDTLEMFVVEDLKMNVTLPTVVVLSNFW